MRNVNIDGKKLKHRIQFFENHLFQNNVKWSEFDHQIFNRNMI